MTSFTVTRDQLRRFQDDGFFVVDSLLSREEVELLGKIARRRHADEKQAASRRDGQGARSGWRCTTSWTTTLPAPSSARRRIVDAMEQLLGGEVYHYHHKMILKEPLTGGAWEWHQDYGYWYNNGCLFPRLASCLIAVDRGDAGNGCLQVLQGSHRMGRIDHGKVGDQTGADLERVAARRSERLELVHCELEPGSAIFFHCNLLHCSAQNRSPDPRWALICCYNAARNDPYKESPPSALHAAGKMARQRRSLNVGRREWESLANPAAPTS